MGSRAPGGRFLRALLLSPLILHSRSVDHAPFHRAITFAKNLRISSSRRSGCSRAAKCPPFGIRVYCTMLLVGLAQRTGQANISFGKSANAIGTVTGGWGS